MQKQVLNLFLPGKFVSPVVHADKFVTTSPWVVNKGLFYPLFKRTLGQFFEAGFYTRWDGLHDDINGIDNFHWVLEYVRILQNLQRHVTEIQLPLKKELWNGYYYASKSGVAAETSSASALVSADSLQALWYLTLDLMVFASLVFLVELCYCFIARRIGRHFIDFQNLINRPLQYTIRLPRYTCLFKK